MRGVYLTSPTAMRPSGIFVLFRSRYVAILGHSGIPRTRQVNRPRSCEPLTGSRRFRYRATLRFIVRAERPLARRDGQQCWIKLHERRIDGRVPLVAGIAILAHGNHLRQRGVLK
jgi:hypothetical protein